MSAVFESDRDEVAPGRSLALMPEWYPRRPSAARMDPVRAGGRVRRLGTTPSRAQMAACEGWSTSV